MPSRQRAALRPLALGIGLALALGALAPSPARAQAPTLAEELAAIVQRLTPPEGRSGVWVQRLGAPEPLFSHHPDQLFTPASVAKLATAGLALDALGPQRRFSTRVLATQAPDAQGLLRGALVLQGGGDPSLRPQDLEALAQQLKAKGLRRISGDLIADASLFAPEGPGAPGWAHDDLAEGYGAAPNGLSVHRNQVTYRLLPGSPGGTLRPALSPSSSYFALGPARGQTLAAGAQASATAWLEEGNPNAWQELLQVRGALPADGGPVEDEAAVRHPDRLTATLFMEALGRQGIALDGQARLGRSPAEASLLMAEHASAPLADLVRTMLKESDNLHAESLLLQAGAATLGLPGTWAKGTQSLNQYLSRQAWAPGGYRLVDGSGLSRYDLVSPHQLGQLLSGVAKDPKAYPSFLVALPIAGVDGTLARRLTQPATRGRIRAKTGSMSGVSSLAGYVDAGAGAPFVAVVLVDHFVGPGAKGRALQDAVFELLAKHAANLPD